MVTAPTFAFGIGFLTLSILPQSRCRGESTERRDPELLCIRVGNLFDSDDVSQRDYAQGCVPVYENGLLKDPHTGTLHEMRCGPSQNMTRILRLVGCTVCPLAPPLYTYESCDFVFDVAQVTEAHDTRNNSLACILLANKARRRMDALNKAALAGASLPSAAALRTQTPQHLSSSHYANAKMANKIDSTLEAVLSSVFRCVACFITAPRTYWVAFTTTVTELTSMVATFCKAALLLLMLFVFRGWLRAGVVLLRVLIRTTATATVAVCRRRFDMNGTLPRPMTSLRDPRAADGLDDGQHEVAVGETQLQAAAALPALCSGLGLENRSKRHAVTVNTERATTAAPLQDRTVAFTCAAVLRSGKRCGRVAAGYNAHGVPACGKYKGDHEIVDAWQSGVSVSRGEEL